MLQALRTHLPGMIVVMFLGGLTSAVAYTIRGYLNIFFLEVMHYDKVDALYLTSFALFVMIVFLPVFGLLADKVGYRRFMYIICAIIFLIILPCYIMLAHQEKYVIDVFIGLIGLGILAAGVCAPAYAYAIKSFEVELRFSGVAFSWNLGLALMGGTTPMISRYLFETISKVAPAYYLMGLALPYILVSVVTSSKHLYSK